jgi:hypothetical protein
MVVSSGQDFPIEAYTLFECLSLFSPLLALVG